MRALAAADMLMLWERGVTRHPIDRAALLAAAARPDLAPDAIADLPLGAVTAGQLGLRTAIFGPRIAGHVDCAHCGDRLELALDAGNLLQPEPASLDDTSPRVVEIEGRRLRAPCLRDLAAVAGETDADQAARKLLELCILSGEGEPVGDGALRAMEDALEAIDPNADLEMELRCDACGHQSVAELDVGALLWDEIAAYAQRLLHEVHLLARAYGWSEAEILALSPARRASYLALVGA